MIKVMKKLVNGLAFLIIFCLIVLLFGFGLFLTQKNQEKEYKSYAEKYLTMFSESFDDQINFLYKEFSENPTDSKFNSFDLSYISDELKEKFQNGVLICKLIDINDSLVSLDETGDIYGICFKNDTNAAYIRLDSYSFDNLLPINAILINNQGKILNSTSPIQGSHLGLYLRRFNIDSKIETEVISSINSGKEVNIRLNVDNEKCYVVTKTTKFSNITFAAIVEEEILKVSTVPYYLPYVILTSASLVFLIFGLIFVNIKINKRYNEISFNELQSTKSSALILKVHRNGKIFYKNKVFSNRIKNSVKFTNVSQFDIYKSRDNDVLAHIKERAPFNVMFKDKNDNSIIVHFVVLIDDPGFELIGEDQTEHHALFNSMVELTQFNQVTNEENRQSFANRFQSYKDSKIKTSFVLFQIMELDRYEKSFSKETENEIIKAVRNNIRTTFDGKEKLYHIENDSFLVAYESSRDYFEAVDYAKLVTSAFTKPISITNHVLKIRVKAGILNLDNEIEIDSSDEAIKNLQVSIKRIENNHTVNYLVFSPKLKLSFDKDELFENELRTAVENNEFIMYYQPQFDNVSNQIVGFESLIRWNTETHITESPQHFIEMAEKNGLIIQIGRFIMRETFQAAKRLEPYNVHISMNISPAQIMQAGFVNELVESFKEFKLRPGSIALEITETAIMGDFQEILEKLKILKNSGFSIHLDDFGTGYSSMMYLKELPIDTIKIDKDFTKHILTDRFSAQIVTMIANLSKALNLQTICEGVETEEQNSFLKANGIRIIQGYLISRAVSYEKALGLLEHYNPIPSSINLKEKGE